MSELRGLQLKAEEFESLGVQIMGVCIDSPEKNRAVVEKLGLDFPILSDPELAFADQFDLRHPESSPTGGDTARPSLYLIENGTIRWRHLTHNWRIRERPEHVLQVVRETLGL